MKPRCRSRPCERPVCATELAEMGFCEKQVELKHRYGPRVSEAREQAMARGRREHYRYFDEGAKIARDAEPVGKCDLASCVFGQSAWQTKRLRRYRDEILLRSWWGRKFVHGYLWVAPFGRILLRRWPLLQRPIRVGLNCFASMLRKRTSAVGRSP